MEKGKNKNKNRIKDASDKQGVSSRLISLWVDVDYTTVSNWNSNKYQPSGDNLNQIGELLEQDNRDLLEPQGRKNTGLAKALQAELNRLRKDEGIPYEIEQFSKEKAKAVKVNNPELIKALKHFAERYKKENGRE